MRNKHGITLIALVITIVVLIILAAVAINLSLGNNGIFNRAKTGKELYQNAEEHERQEIGKSTNKIEEYISSSRAEAIEGETRFLNDSNGFTATAGEFELKSYGLTSKIFPTTYSNDWNRIYYEKNESKNLGKNFELSMQAFLWDSSNANMGGVELVFLKDDQEKAHICLCDAWSAERSITVTFYIGSDTIYSSKFVSMGNMSGRYTITGDGTNVTAHLGSINLGSINYNQDFEYDKIRVIFTKYGTAYATPDCYVESIYAGKPLYYK